MTERLILIRHGDLGDGCRGRYIGRTDAPLSAEGRRQAAALAEPLTRLPDGTSRFVSPLRRTRETAEIALGSGVDFTIDSDLREIDFGRWEGMGFAEILAADPAAVDQWVALAEDFVFPEGENIANFRKRIAAAARRIAADPVGTAVVVTHGGVIRFMICHFLGFLTPNRPPFRRSGSTVERAF
jgi:alpha-ribazole phosphatase